MSNSFSPSDSDFDSASDGFNDNFNNAQDTFNKTTQTISTAWIVGIVIIALAVITAAGVGIWFLRRNSRRRRQRQEMEDKSYAPNTDNASAPGGGTHHDYHSPPSDGRVSPYPQHQQHPQYQPPMQQYGQNPWQEGGDQTRVEAQDTGVSRYWEAPDTSASAKTEKTEQPGGGDSTGWRSELPATTASGGTRELA